MPDDMPIGTIPVLLLIQGDKVVDRSLRPEYLHTEKIDEYAGFKVALGYADTETGLKKVVAVLADVAPLDACDYWRISSEYYDNVVIGGSDYRPAAFVKYSLRDLTSTGRLRYPPNLPPTLTIKPDSMRSHRC